MRDAGPSFASQELQQWRRQNARLLTLVNSWRVPRAVVDEAFALQRECEHMAEQFRMLGEQRLQQRRQRPGR